jgi:hypothetical protein
VIINERGQIIGDLGIEWLKNERGYWSIDPGGYFIERDGHTWVLFRKTTSAFPKKVPYVKQVLTRGTIAECMRVAEIYFIRRVL